ncbi:MAG: 23S rRNA (guanosine(2251)-2'-O)-methyltransferase RlmB [Leptospiraceae bacterium]|nr:23S rRNA (guanosine(2251)-2'-O)-methyltransferase RlmB [Leptospiraceae bacterium]
MKKKAIYGRHSVEEYILKNGSNDITEVWVKDSFHGEATSTFLSNIPNKSIIKKKDIKDIDRILKGVNHQGIVIWSQSNSGKSQIKDFNEWKTALEEAEGPFLLLDRIQDPGNLGNILRTAECMGIQSVILTDRNSCGITDVVIKVSSGALNYLNLFQVANLSRVIEELKKKNYWIVATSDRGEDEWEDLPEPERIAIIMGNEGEGAKRLLLEESDFVVQIPMHGEISSLNVAVATGIVLDRIVNR